MGGTSNDDTDIRLSDAPTVEHNVFPTDRTEAWHAWKPTDDGRKVPRAPWLNPEWPDKFVSDDSIAFARAPLITERADLD